MWSVEVAGALLYMLLLGFASAVTPGVGIAGSALAQCPSPVINLGHAPAYGVLTWLLGSGLRKRGRPERMALRLAMAAAMVFGVCMEIMQGFIPGRVVDGGDVALNAVGIALAALMIQSLPVRLLTVDGAIVGHGEIRRER